MKYELGQKLISSQGKRAVITKRVFDVDTNETLYQILVENETFKWHDESRLSLCYFKEEN